MWRLRKRESAVSESLVTSVSPSVIVPASGRSKVPITWSKVVFPAPEAPTMLTISPWAMSVSMPFSTSSVPNDLWMSRMERMDMGGSF